MQMICFHLLTNFSSNDEHIVHVYGSMCNVRSIVNLSGQAKCKCNLQSQHKPNVLTTNPQGPYP